MPILSVCYVYNKANTYGIRDDIAVIDGALKAAGAPAGWNIGPARHLDVKDPPIKCDIQIHLEHPIYVNIPWARYNILMVNPEYYYPAAYDPYLPKFDMIICKDETAAAHFRARCEGTGTAVRKISWIAPVETASSGPRAKGGFVSFVGGSEMKCRGLEGILDHWSRYPLMIYTTRSDLSARLQIAAAGNELVTVRHQDLDAAERTRLQRYYSGHVVVSQGEGFGHAAAKGFMAGSFLILNQLPVYVETYGDVSEAVGWLRCEAGPPAAAAGHLHPTMKYTNIADDLAAAFDKYESWTPISDADLAAIAAKRRAEFAAAWAAILDGVFAPGFGADNRRLPPVVEPAACPPISIITITYNRRRFIDLCAYNLLLTDYPRDKIEWIVVEDSDDDNKSGSDKIAGFADKHPEFKVTYIPVTGPTCLSIGEKRNLGVKHATADICLFMDDDDFYPQTSFRRRVSWLLRGGGRAVTITSMALYDLEKGTSAVNVPPWNIGLSKRVSEAALCFYKSFWEEREFPVVNMAEGERWLEGREADVVEIPPQQIIVALSHGTNMSSRRVPADTPVGCGWGWPAELLKFLHGLIGVAVEDAGGSGGGATAPAKKKKPAGRR